MAPTQTRPSTHFFKRDDDGSSRMRLRFRPALVSKIEEAAGEQDLLDWIYETLETRADQVIESVRASRPDVGHPTD